MKTLRRSLVVFLASTLVTTIAGVATNASAAWTRTVDSGGCRTWLIPSSTYSQWQCPIISDTTYYGGNVSIIYLDFTIPIWGGGTSTLKWRSGARSYNWGHVSYGATTTETINVGGFYDRVVNKWTEGGWGAYDYYW